jgi:PAS domain S-box-containing protein
VFVAAGEAAVPVEALEQKVLALEHVLAESRATVAAQEQLLLFGHVVSIVSKELGSLEAHELDAGIVRALAAFVARTRVDAGMVCLFSRDRAWMEVAHVWPPTPEPEHTPSPGLPLDRFRWSVDQILALAPVHVPVAADLPAEAAGERMLCAQGGVRSVLFVPLVHRGEAIGFVSFASIAAERTWTEGEIALTRMAADLFAGALVRGRSSGDWAKVFECLRSLGADSRANLERLTALAGEIVGGTCALYNRLHEGRLCAWGRWRTPPDYRAVDLPDGHLCNDVILGADDGLVVIRDLQASSYAESDRNVRAFGLQTYVGRVVRANGARVGSLCVVFQRDFQPSSDQRRMLEAIADAVAVEEVRKSAHEALQRSAGDLRHTMALLEATLEATADGVLAVDARGRPLRHNRRFLELWAIPPHVAAAGDGVAMLEHAATLLPGVEAERASWIRLAGDPEASEFTTFELRDRRIVERSSIPLAVGGGHVGRVFSFRDVTERASGEASRALLATAVEQAGEGVLITDRNGAIEYVNPTFERMSGHRLDGVRGKTPRVLRSDRHDADTYRALWATISSGAAWSGRLVNKRADGTLFEVDEVIAPVRMADGTIGSYVGILRDVTREHQLEEEVRQAQKMEAVGRLAGGIAHDFNNLLTAMIGYAEMIDAELDGAGPIAEDVREIRRAADRAANLTRQLLAFSRRQVLQPRVLDLNDVLANMEKMLKRLIPESVAMRTALQGALWPIKADRGQLEQVVLNLSLNARDAMPDEGRLELTTENVTLERATLVGHDAMPPGRYVRLSVSDDGLGMDAATLTRIFEPFFTTKGVGKGTGLGLATVYGIVRQSGGAIEVESRPLAGTTFRLLFPASNEVERPAPAAGPPVPKAQAAQTLLLAEDEPGVRNVAAKALRGQGYLVLEAADGVEALELAQAHGAKIDALVTDVVMPRMGGPELVRRLCAERPLLPVLFMSGHVDASVSGRELPTGAAFLPKPFAPEALRRAVHDLLTPRGG